MNPSALPETKPEDLSIAAMWAFFETAVLPPEASLYQREEMKNAYYAGFIDCFKLTGDVSTKLTEEKSFEVLSRVRAEAHEHFLTWLGSVAERPAPSPAADALSMLEDMRDRLRVIGTGPTDLRLVERCDALLAARARAARSVRRGGR